MRRPVTMPSKTTMSTSLDPLSFSTSSLTGTRSTLLPSLLSRTASRVPLSSPASFASSLMTATSSRGALLERASFTSSGLSCSTSFPLGALATYLGLATCKSSLRIRSPPLSPSRKAVTSFFLTRFFMVWGTFTPSRAMTPVTPLFIRFMTSALPSTRMTSFFLDMSGVAVSLSLP